MAPDAPDIGHVALQQSGRGDAVRAHHFVHELSAVMQPG